MPGGDGTGPLGFGPLTGRAAGYCAGYSVPGYANPYPRGGRGLGRAWGRGGGFGRGMAWRRGFVAPPYPAQYWGPFQGAVGAVDVEVSEAEVRALKNHARMLKEELSDIEKRLKELESAGGEDDD